MITITKNKNILSLKTYFNGIVNWHDLKLSIDVPQDVITNWLLMKVKPIWELMPLDDFKISCQDIEDIKQSVYALANIIEATNEATNEAIKKYCNNKKWVSGSAKDFLDTSNEIVESFPKKDDFLKQENILFWNVSEDMRYKSLYDRLNKNSNNSIKYFNMELGFDRIKREWNHTDVPMSVDEFVSYLAEHQIGKIITVNQYILDKYISSTAVNLMALCKHLGIEWITIDNDPADLNISGYYRRYAYNDNDNSRFSNLSCLVEYFDKEYDASNIHYVAIPQDYSSEKRKQLTNDYDIIVLSNSRYQNVKSMLPGIETICNALLQETIYQDINTWYLAMRKLILEIMPFDELKRFKTNSLLHHFYFACVQWLKWKIIGDIETDRKVKVYGDVGWKEVCPQYYQGSLDNNQINTLYKESNHLFLLLNCSFSYLDASAPVYDVIRRNVPWINMPPMVKTDVFKPLSTVEYTDKISLNRLINDYNESNGLDVYSDILSSSVADIENGILKIDENGESDYTFHRYEHAILMNEIVDDYLDMNEPFLRHCYEGLFCTEKE